MVGLTWCGPIPGVDGLAHVNLGGPGTFCSTRSCPTLASCKEKCAALPRCVAFKYSAMGAQLVSAGADSASQHRCSQRRRCVRYRCVMKRFMSPRLAVADSNSSAGSWAAVWSSRTQAPPNCTAAFLQPYVARSVSRARSRPRYAMERARGGCASYDAHNRSQPPPDVLSNASLLSYLYPAPWVAAGAQPSRGHAARSSFAIVTVHHQTTANSSAGCGLVKWCHSAAAFAASAIFPPGAAEALVVTNHPTWVRNECYDTRVGVLPIDPTLAGLVQAWGAIQKPGVSLL